MEEVVRISAAAIFQTMGVRKGVNDVAILGENSARWLMIIDHGIQLAGGAWAVRGADAMLR
jgi:long-chain acyl-CoA synthetase